MRIFKKSHKSTVSHWESPPSNNKSFSTFLRKIVNKPVTVQIAERSDQKFEKKIHFSIAFSVSFDNRSERKNGN